ncbi:unknown [Crocosphaera subtropica ATCC 51142]|uniref:J domain-containing protein n=1 Tax=Crocosphaera subtropica (strain ATCC 51142 / BH68) TaxID=43989 RepID=B1X101_CROS5|nr:IMS domain-containing protein [Crocosphaera subtropica]ACB49642.1 unknown [Crocosphaera subtropica ATCC 51142]
MRIPLDYYRILGIFPQVTDEQLRQAYRDRSIQLPRREYSNQAIQSRRQLLEQAYGVLSNPAQKAKYEAQFWQDQASYQEAGESPSPRSATEAVSESSPLTTAEIDIEPEQLTGSLLILHELGEYELVIKYGESYLQTLPTSSLSLDIDDTATKHRTDTILSIALAYLEISREQWHQQAYEPAALAGTQGLTLLEKNNLFPSIQTEIRAELHKLRPYRILELLAAPLKNTVPRQTGIKLLQSMLEERQGIDGKGDDHSGLGIDDFLRFIQQIRTYLTAEEQKDIFIEEAQRPSSVAAYLGVYALIAQGFAQKQPSLILEAKTVLEGLEPRQDVSIEQSIVALLLGQTQAAAQALERCQDQQALKFIRENSQGAPDLLPGLCRYGEHWLQTEVFAHFRDLKEKTASLKEYFADQDVQTYLNQLLTPSPPKPQGVMNPEKNPPSRSRLHNNRRYPRYQPLEQGNAALDPVSLPVRSLSPIDIRDVRRRKRKQYAPKPDPQPIRETVLEQSPNRKPASTQTVPLAKTLPTRPPRRSPKVGLTAVAIVGGVGLIGLGITWMSKANSPLSALEKGQYSVSLHQPLIDIPSADAQMVTATGMLTLEGAQQVVETWLSSKSQAFGQSHDIESLKTILANPLLSRWQRQAQQLQQNQNYWTYKHQVQVNSFKPSTNNPNQAVVDANVQESAQYYQGGRVSRSYNDNLRVRYDLIRQGDRWLIQGINVIN